MYRLLIVDDEQLITDGLYEIFNGLDSLELDVYKAYSTEDALAWMNRARIDIVVSDIQMPGMDGLRLSEEILSRWAWCRIIFLTGHAEFEYVYKAIQPPNTSFILKTEDTDKLIEVVENAINQIRECDRRDELTRKAEDQIVMVRELFQKDYFLRLLSGDSISEPSNELFSKLGSPLRADYPLIVAVGNILNRSSGDYYEQIQRIYPLKQVIDKYLSARVIFTMVFHSYDRISLLVQPKEVLCGKEIDSALIKTNTFLTGAFEAIQNSAKLNLGLDIDFALSELACEWAALPEKYSDLNMRLNSRLGAIPEILLSDGERNSASFSVVSPSDTTRLLEIHLRRFRPETFSRFLETGQSEEFFAEINPLLDALANIGSKHDGIAEECYLSVSSLILSYINRYQLAEKMAFRFGRNKLTSMDLHSSWVKASEFLRGICRILFENRSDEQKSRSDEIVRLVETYVENHLDDELSLLKLSERVYLNPSYLSRLYKQIRGENLSEFIDKSRVFKAKRLLESQNYKISDIATSVGYENSASFTRLFKKVEGLTPQEYRDTIIKQVNT